MSIYLAHLEPTPELLGSLGELYYKEYCAQHGWAYISLEQIYKNRIQNGKLEFKFGFERILISIPLEIQQEIIEISKPSNGKADQPSFVYDFLACRAYDSDNPRYLDDVTIEDFRWIEVKTGKSKLSENQINTAKKIKIPLIKCHIANVLAPPQEIRIFWDEVNSEYLSQYNI